jgi:hypothetical protein
MAGGGSKPGERRGGRQRGSPNRRNVEVVHKLTALDCDPIAGMAQIALGEKNPVELRARMFAGLAQYVALKRKAVEHSAQAGTIEALLARIEG